MYQKGGGKPWYQSQHQNSKKYIVISSDSPIS